ncbi:Lectin receptor kinase [Thalictrum thalictroides]|uniref:Lectin receptor kinase n=1 Tax=Thalictrum thalictroides TaxID=46969 RepID=A0A7J6V4X4_THATH|nr:Lectin receptor kinase [Thalictrum thalictroides]
MSKLCFAMSSVGDFFVVVISLFLLLLPPTNPIPFRITWFDPGSNEIIYEGSARPSLGAVEFNSQTYYSQVGRATYAKPVQVWDSNTGKLTDFSTHFTFTIDTQGSPLNKYAAGLAFFLAPVGFPIPPNSAGGFLGLFNTTTIDATTQNHVVFVEFDTFPNPEWDPTDVVQHVGINVNSIHSATYVAWNASLYSDQRSDAWVTYNASTKNLSVLLTYSNHSSNQDSYYVSYIVDLTEILPEWVTIGFSATTNYYIERNLLNFWEFNSSLNVKVADGTKKGRSAIGLKIGLPVSAGVLICAGIGVAWFRVKRKHSTEKEEEEITNLTSMNRDFERGVGPKRFTYRELSSATNNFSDDRKLGEGGFGGVYRGVLNNTNMEVAVKRISRSSKQGRREYMSEVKIISRLRHRNLVQLIGWCHDQREFLLVYEYMTNGSLDSHLFGKKNSLSWEIRYKISLGLASALFYLHEEWEQCVVHRDIKSSNMMLDSSFNVKLGDFGLARLMDHELGPQSTGLAGTVGYLAPEYIRTGRASKESDVFSFGVVALEIACGKKSVDPMEKDSDVGLVEWVWDLYGNGMLLSAVDERLCMEFDEKQMECLMIVGLWCAHPDRILRPTIRQAIQVLHSETLMPSLPTKMPVPMYQHCQSSQEASISNTSIWFGR